MNLSPTFDTRPQVKASPGPRLQPRTDWEETTAAPVLEIHSTRMSAQLADAGVHPEQTVLELQPIISRGGSGSPLRGTSDTHMVAVRSDVRLLQRKETVRPATHP